MPSSSIYNLIDQIMSDENVSLPGSPIHYPSPCSPSRFAEGSTVLTQHLQRLQLHQTDLYSAPSPTGAQGVYCHLPKPMVHGY